MKLADKIALFIFCSLCPFFNIYIYKIHCELDFCVVPRYPENSSHFKPHAKCTSKLEE